MNDATTTEVGHATASRSSRDERRLAVLRSQAVNEGPRSASRAAWAWLSEFQDPAQHARLGVIFALGTAPACPDGDCEGQVLGLYGDAWLHIVDQLVRAGQLLGGIGWTGKTFDAPSGRGYNRLTASARVPMGLAMPTYRFRRMGRELIGFDFEHRIDQSPFAPHGQVRAITYDLPEFKSPLVMPNIRDEIVELVPGVYLGRVLHRHHGSWRLVGYFALRGQSGAGA